MDGQVVEEVRIAIACGVIVLNMGGEIVKSIKTH